MNSHASASRSRDVSTPRMPSEPPQALQGAFLSLAPELQRAVQQQGYHTPSPIQEQCIPLLLEGRDIIGSAQTGTGKTAAFTLPVLQRLNQNPRKRVPGTPRVLILAPTRELAAQIGESIENYGQFYSLKHVVIFGGVSQFHQVKALQRGIDILVATPGRLLDLMQQGYIHLTHVEVFILDEVDRMLDMGFIPDIRRVLTKLPSQRQTLFFSATLPPDMKTLAESMVKNAARVAIAPEEPTVDRIAQSVFFVDKKNKESLLTSLLKQSGPHKTIIFTQMKHVANRISDKLQKNGIRSAAIHGNKSQGARTRALDGFKQGQFQVLVATDVAARGLDVNDITHVINYDLPVEAETYVHRIGRTARAGAEGKAYSFCTEEDRAYLRDIERLLGNPVPVDSEHDYHCESASRSTMAPPKNFGRSGGGGSRGRGNQGGRRGGPPSGAKPPSRFQRRQARRASHA